MDTESILKFKKVLEYFVAHLNYMDMINILNFMRIRETLYRQEKVIMVGKFKTRLKTGK